MALYNIETKLSASVPKATWNTGNDRNNISINNNSFYFFDIIIHTDGDHVFLVDTNTQSVPQSSDRYLLPLFLRSQSLLNKLNNQTLPDPLANFTYSYYDKIHLAKFWKPIIN